MVTISKPNPPRCLFKVATMTRSQARKALRWCRGLQKMNKANRADLESKREGCQRAPQAWHYWNLADSNLKLMENLLAETERQLEARITEATA